MSEEAHALATRFRAVNDELIAILEGCSPRQWQARCLDEDRPVGVVAHHVAGAHRTVAGWVGTIAAGQPLPPFTQEQIDQGNARHAERYASPDKEETITRLRQNGDAAADVVQGLSDEQLDRTGTMPLFGDQPVSARWMIIDRLIGHVTQHGASIKATLAATAP